MNTNSIPPEIKVLQDLDKKGRERPWTVHAKAKMELSKVYAELGDERKHVRLHLCGSALEFKECDSGHKNLKRGMFCKISLCPTCQWRKSRVTFRNLIKVVHEAKKRKRIELIHLTLTAKTVKEYELKDQLDLFFKSWDRLGKRKAFQKAVLGWFRSLEIKHDMHKGTYHPHFHCILAVRSSYFKSRDYLNKQDWISLWQESMKLDYEPSVWVEKIKPRKARNKAEFVENMSPEAKQKAVEKAVVETTKYTTKAGDYLNDFDPEGTVRAVKTLDVVLRKRRLISWGGLFKEIHRELDLKDGDQANLVHDDDKEPEACNCDVCGGIMKEVLYRWNTGYSNYIVDDRGWTWREKEEWDRREHLSKEKAKKKAESVVAQEAVVEEPKKNDGASTFDLDPNATKQFFPDWDKSTAVKIEAIPSIPQAPDEEKPKQPKKKDKTPSENQGAIFNEKDYL